MKIGDLVMTMKDDFTFEHKTGIILTWVRTGGPMGTIWEVLFEDCAEYWDENDLMVINESR